MASRFALQVSEYAKAAGEQADRNVRAIALDAFGRIATRSPVDTGRFRANWRLNVGSVDYTTTEGVTAKAPSLPEKVAGTVLYISNNLPYARRLEYGWSKQAPQGMVRLTVAEFDAIADRGGR
jgi:hypothetical protein